MTVPKRRQPRPVTEAQACADIAAWLAHVWPAYAATEAAIAHPTIRASADPTRSGDTPDPTHAIVASLEHHAETREGLAGALAQLRWVQSRVRRVLREHPDIASEADATVRALRCSGEIDPTCTRNAVRTGLCWRCYRASLDRRRAS